MKDISDEELAKKLKGYKGSKKDLLDELDLSEKELKERVEKLKSIGLLSEFWYGILISRFFLRLFKRWRKQ